MKPIIAITAGDINGVGYEIILKSLMNPHICEICRPIVYGNAKVARLYAKTMADEFHNVQWDFSFVYLLGVTGNVSTFMGEKMFLKEFIERYKQFGFSVMDETYGYNMTKYCGYLLSKRQHHECIIEIYHEGDMVFVSGE